MIQRFPLFYIAWLYVFSTKDKIVFFMGQFATLATALTIATIICTFSIMNGVNDQIRQSIGSYADIVILSSLPTEYPDNQSEEAHSLEIAQIYNKGFNKFTINDKEIRKMEFVRQQQTLVNYQGKAYYLMIEENPEQTQKAMADEATLKAFPALKQSLLKGNSDSNSDNENNNLISIFDSQSYNPMFGLMTRALHYGTLPESSLKSAEATIYLSSAEYEKLFHNNNYNTVRIYLKDDELAPLVAQDIKKKLNNSFSIHQWKELKPDLLDALDLQKKIFNLVYTVLFTLLCAIIISTNVAFFKDKRKDWALYKILNVFPYSVERIFLYKSLISFLLSLAVGFALGIVISIYSNEIINFFMLLGHHGSDRLSRYVFGLPKITYVFHWQDFIYVMFFSLAIHALNFITLALIFRHEKVSDFLNAS
jgi:ABC-type lipoprotein release transport system permease subunit